MRHRVHRHLSFLGCANTFARIDAVGASMPRGGYERGRRPRLVATVDDESGSYEVRSREPSWVFAGTLGGPASDIGVKDGQDRTWVLSVS